MSAERARRLRPLAWILCAAVAFLIAIVATLKLADRRVRERWNQLESHWLEARETEVSAWLWTQIDPGATVTWNFTGHRHQRSALGLSHRYLTSDTCTIGDPPEVDATVWLFLDHEWLRTDVRVEVVSRGAPLDAALVEQVKRVLAEIDVSVTSRVERP